jgi:hypothetical protein
MSNSASVIELLSGRTDWQNPDRSLLGTGRRRPPQFPLDLMKPFWAGWIRSAAKAASAPVDYVATGVPVCGGRMPEAGGGSPPILWVAVVGSPSSGKSPALDAVVELLGHVEEKMAEGFEERRRSPWPRVRRTRMRSRQR